MPTDKPSVSVAAICENILQDKDNVISAIRIIDVLGVDFEGSHDDAVNAGVVPIVPANLLIVLKSVDFHGTCSLRIDSRAPDGEVKTGNEIQLEFLGENHGLTINAKLGIAVRQFGMFYFDLICGGELLTTIPLRIVPIQDLAAERLRYRPADETSE